MAFDGKGRKEIALGNPLVLRTIFECMSTKQLVRISRVNKLWNYEARCVLRDKRKCVAVIDGDRPCLKAKKLNQILRSLNVNFLNGLSITLEKHETGSSLTRKRVEDGYGNLVKMPWKYLEIEWSRVMTEDCLLSQFILRLMAKSSTLEYLIIKDMPLAPFGVELKDENRPEGALELPKLKILQVPEAGFLQYARELLPGLLARAPNVEMENMMDPELMGMMPADKLKTIKKLHIPHVDDDGAIIRLLDAFLASEPKLHALSAYAPRFPDRSPRMAQDFFDRLVAVIYSSSETLREVKLESFVAYMLCVSVRARLFPPVLKNVKDLTFEIYKGKEPGIVRYLMRAMLAQMFPDLVSLTMSTYSQFTQHTDEIGPNDNEMSPWPAIKKVRFRSSGCTDVAIMELQNIFPNLRCLDICFLDAPPTTCLPFGQIWSSLQCLQELTISGKLKKNYDAEFCGICPKEAALLRRMDDEYLKTVNIVPLFSPVSHIRGLKVIQVELETKNFFLSKVSLLITLKQLPTLEFRLRAPSEAADQLEYLKPYVKLDLQNTE